MPAGQRGRRWSGAGRWRVSSRGISCVSPSKGNFLLGRGEAPPIAIVHGEKPSGTTHLGDESEVRPRSRREEPMREFAAVARNAASPIRYARAKLNSTDFRSAKSGLCAA